LSSCQVVSALSGNTITDQKCADTKILSQRQSLTTLVIQAIYVKSCSIYIQFKGDIVVVDIKQHKSQFKNLNITITQSAKFF